VNLFLFYSSLRNLLY